MTELAEVHRIYATNCRSIPDMLRQSADSIASEVAEGFCRTKAMIAVQLSDDGHVQVYGWGETDMVHALGVLTAGTHKIGDMVLDTGE
jgi:hypothetical protein